MYSLILHEEKPHGTKEFPVEYHYVDKDHPQYHMAFHWHKEWEIIRILEGEFLLRADGEEYLAHAGDVFLMRDGMLHGGTPRDCVYECFLFDLHGLFRDVNAVKKYLRPIYRNHLLPQVGFPGKQEDVYPIVDELLGYFRQAKRNALRTAIPGQASPDVSYQGDLCELVALGDISRLFAVILDKGYLLPEANEPQNSSRKVLQLKTVLEYIENHFAEKMTLEDLARVAGLSPKYFCRFFRSITQQTPMDYVNYYRIERAASLLSSTDLSVTAVGMECGFNDGSYFVKAFKKYMGLTPRQYQRANL